MSRYRNWAFLAYPESAADGWLEILKRQGLRGFVSPLHTPDDQDIKPHYHVLLKFDSAKSMKQVQALSKLIDGSKMVVPVMDFRSYARYLLHLDDTSKQQWPDASGITPLGGAVYDDEIKTPEDEVMAEVEQLREMMTAVSDAGLMDWRSMIVWMEVHGHVDWIAWLYQRSTATAWMRDTLRSAYHQWQRQQQTENNRSIFPALRPEK